MSIDEIEKASCVKFRPATVADKDWVEIDNKETGCFAILGYNGPGHGKHEVNLERKSSSGTCITKGVIVHELLHILGVNHEQNRPDRDNYMKINWKNMQVYQ